MDSLLSQPFHCPPPRPSLPFAQLTGILTIRHDTAGQRAIWEFNVDQMQKGSLSGLCEGINPSSRLDSRPAALFILLIPSSPPLWNSLYCRGLVPPESGVLTPLRTVEEGGAAAGARCKRCAIRYPRKHLGFLQRTGMVFSRGGRGGVT